uniref:Uncharacterized protein n=1 Tax=Onchocerca volvulus TaxID=6282 RepID=A0A8R1TPB1_ONCVO
MAIVLFCRRQNKFYSQAFVLVALQIIISHFLGFIPQLVVVIPEILQTKNNLFANQTTWINKTFSTFGTFAIYAITFGDYYFCARKFLVWNLNWKRDCAKSKGKGETWWRIRDVWALIIPNIMFIMYIAIFYNIRRKQRSTADINRNQKKKKILAGHKANSVKTSDYEWSMLIQAALNCGTIEIGIFNISFLSPLLIRIFGERITIPSRIFVNCNSIFICAMLPTVFFIYSKEARNTVKEYLDRFLHLRTALLKTKVFIINAWINAGQQ